MTTPERWRPDDQLIPAFLAGRRPEGKIADEDKSWVVAGLSLAGKKAEDIAALMGCSLRQVRLIRAQPMTQVCRFYQTESKTFADELRLAQAEITASHRNAVLLQTELARIRTRLNKLIGKSTLRCGHPNDRGNVYEHRGKRYCRTCRRKHSAECLRRRASRDARPNLTLLKCEDHLSGPHEANTG